MKSFDWRNPYSDSAGIDVICRRINVNVNRLCPKILDRIRHNDTGESGKDYFVTILNTHNLQDGIEGYASLKEEIPLSQDTPS